MKKKNKHAQLKRRKEFKFHNVELVSHQGKEKNLRHPPYVFLEKGNIYIYVTITHSNNVPDNIVIKLRKNPNPADQREAYRVVEIKSDTKDNFGRREIGWKMDDQDDDDIRSEYEKR